VRSIRASDTLTRSPGCPVICEFAYRYPDRIDRAVLVSPAGGIFNQPLRRAVGQLSQDGPREPP
jgi:pimeloyl-ACP methyl ester carboxylesterase